MKKLVGFLCLSAMMAVSCSDDDTEEYVAPQISVLLQKTVDTNIDGTTFTTVYTYDGSKLVKITDSDDEVIAFTYNGDDITKMDFKDDMGVIYQTNTYTYTAGKLATFVMVEPTENYGTKEVYTYNEDGTVTVTAYYGDALAQTEENGTGTITFSNGEVSHIDTEFSTEHVYTYDDQNNPSHFITGMDKIAFAGCETSGILHNVKTDKIDGVVATTLYTQYTTIGLPKKSQETYMGETVKTEYFY